ncbi:hypothetical protein [Halomonas salinarum]|uniref:hypothetical protein n=1 Tax=Halomonas salinarum TaxID=1158993 RepID=UPI001439AE3C|nr:hypothetical protein [Halomonas salinarum]
MKINLEFDLTPAEFRQSLGLPDVEAFHNELMSRIQQQMDAGAEGYDPMSLLQPFLKSPFMPPAFQDSLKGNFQDNLNQGMSSFGNYQQMMLDMLRKAQAASSQPKEEEESSTADKSKSADEPASASSRSHRK